MHCIDTSPAMRLGTLWASICLLFAAMLLTSCDDSSPYRRGFDAGEEEGRRQGYKGGFDAGKVSGIEEGEKSGRDAGFRMGAIVGYTQGTVEIVGKHWRPSLALGLCLGLAGLVGLGGFLLLRGPVRGAASTVVSSVSALRSRCLAGFLERRTQRLIARLSADEKAANECQARILIAGALRRVQNQLSAERLQLAVETFIRESELLRELDAHVDVMTRAASEAHQLIQSHSDLQPHARLALLRKLATTLFPPADSIGSSHTPPAGTSITVTSSAS